MSAAEDRVSITRTSISAVAGAVQALVRAIPRNPLVLEVGRSVDTMISGVKALDKSPATVLDKSPARSNAARKRKKSGFDKTAYQRDYMRKKRAEARAAKAAAPAAPVSQGKANARKRGKSARG